MPKNIYHKLNDAFTHSQITTVGFPQGSNIVPFLFNFFTNKLPLNANTLRDTFVDDNAILTIKNDPIQATQNIQKPPFCVQHLVLQLENQS